MLVRIFRAGRKNDEFEVPALSEAIVHLKPEVPVEVQYSECSLACGVRIVAEEGGYKLLSVRGVISEESVRTISQGEDWKERM